MADHLSQLLALASYFSFELFSLIASYFLFDFP